MSDTRPASANRADQGTIVDDDAVQRGNSLTHHDGIVDTNDVLSVLASWGLCP
ncbi:MAG: hypothetical protein MK101_11700 [Phycisphaerales bacterium]|nr:hypothetical protein [Phycisphaerales bacterium]